MMVILIKRKSCQRYALDGVSKRLENIQKKFT